MGDRCYMQVTCRRQDMETFRDVGFEFEDMNEEAGTSPTVTMVDCEANSAHYGEMPIDVPYYGWHSEGGIYGSMEFCCDGETHLEVGICHGDGYVVTFELAEPFRPGQLSIDHVQAFLRLKQKVMGMFEGLGVEVSSAVNAP